MQVAAMDAAPDISYPVRMQSGRPEGRSGEMAGDRR